ncbi:glycoside hydrolase family 47 protein [Acidomyces richmondensis BFW]|nr:MAG: glycoside hydrolase family 47 protein [Acidomyces sp. 'richmondensis']KYG48132.1 glycoside hydrolase family 47 protein [Acidomyces richmondensis BFW]
MAYSQSGPTQRHPDLWQSAHSDGFANGSVKRAGVSVSDKISDIFSNDRRASLPMYKDKPSGYYPGGRKYKPWFRRRRLVLLLLAGLAGLSWWFGILSPISYISSGDGRPKSTSSSWNLFGSTPANWDERAEKVKHAFKLSFGDYEKHAWGDDEYHPIAKTGKKMTPKGMGWIIIDALDTMMLMNLTTELEHARQWIHDDLTYDQDHDVNTFETTIRMLGGLLSAHYLSTGFDGRYGSVSDGLSDDLYVEKATDLADRLLGAFETQSGVPFASVNLHTMKGIPSHADAGASSTAEATSVQLELKYLAKLTGEEHYWHKAERVMKVVDDNDMKDGLVPIFIYADRGVFRGNNIRLGSRGDSYYEYLIKQYLQTSQQEPVYQAMWNESLAGIKKHLLTYSFPSNFTVLAEKPNGLNQEISPKMDHLVCFMPGTIALATTGGLPLEQARRQSNWGPEQEEDMKLAEELMKTCWGMYTVTPTGLAGEITYFNIHSPPLMYNEFTSDNRPQSPKSLDPLPQLPGLDPSPVGARDYIIKGSDSHNLQRPETVESLFYMWRITGEEKYREWGWQMFQNFITHTATPDMQGYSSIGNVLTVPPPLRDNMESFWLAETLKYFYLLFSSNDILPLNEVVFNTEAHAFPRFQLGKLFKTGWERKKRDAESDLSLKTMPEENRNKEVKAQTTRASVTSTVLVEGSLGTANDAAEMASVMDMLANAQ